MAEAAAVIGLVSSIASLVELGIKIVSRVEEYVSHAAEMPKTFRSLAHRLPLLIQSLQSIQARARAGYIASNVAKELELLVVSVLQEVELVERCLKRIIPDSGASRFDRALSGFRSLAKDEKINQAVDKIHHGIDVIVLHQTTSNIEVSDQILQELRKLHLGTAPPQSVPGLAGHGLCFGRAPLTEPDAFIGRQAEIEQLHTWLAPTQNAKAQQTIVSVVGMGGMGKTQLSLAYAREHGHAYSSVFWLSAKDRTSLHQSMSALTAIIFPDDTTTAAHPNEEDRQVEEVLRWFSEASNDHWLIIFDNYDDPSLPNVRSQTGFDIRQFFPTRAQGSILITTRSSKLNFSKQMKLQKIKDLDTCISVLSQRSGRDMTEDEPTQRDRANICIDQGSQRLATRLDGLPLALAIAGTYLAQTNASCEDYLDLYETTWSELHGPDAEELMEYEDRTLSSTWRVSLDQVRRLDADAAELLQFFGYLNNDDIWFELIRAGAEKGPPWMGRVTNSKICFDRAMSKLVEYSLVEATNGLYRVHPCLHDWIWKYLDDPIDEFLFKTTIRCLGKSIPGTQKRDLQYWKLSRRLLKHMNRIRHQDFDTLWGVVGPDPDMTTMTHTIGKLYHALSEFVDGEKLLLWSLARAETAFGQGDPRTLNIADSLGNLYRDRGQPNRAEEMLVRALTGYEKVFGRDHIRTLPVVGNLGNLYLDQNRLDEAEQMQQRTLAGSQKTHGPDHFLTLQTLSNLGIVYACQGKQVQAEEMYTKALAGFEKKSGPDDERTLDARNNLAVCFVSQGQLDRAEELHTQILATKEKLYGRQHASTIRTVFNLAGLYDKQGRLSKSEEMYEHVLGASSRNRPDLYHKKAIHHFAAVLKKDICTSKTDLTHVQDRIARLVQHVHEYSESDARIISYLAGALVWIKDDENAPIAYFYGNMYVHGAKEDFKDITCSGCRRVIGISTGHQVCRHCDSISLCNECMSQYTIGSLSLPACEGHEYCDIGSVVSCGLKSGEQFQSRKQMYVWLARMRDKYTDHAQADDESTAK